jgi:hypothetical protein
MRSHSAPPNMTNLLYQWGLESIIKSTTEQCRRSVFAVVRTRRRVKKFFCRIDYVSHTGEDMGAMPVEDEFLEDLVADFRFIQVRS